MDIPRKSDGCGMRASAIKRTRIIADHLHHNTAGCRGVIL